MKLAGDFAQLPPLPGQRSGSSMKSGESQSGLKARFPFPYPMEATGSRRSSVAPPSLTPTSRQVSGGVDGRVGERAAPANVPHLEGVPEKPEQSAAGSGVVQPEGVRDPVQDLQPQLQSEPMDSEPL